MRSFSKKYVCVHWLAAVFPGAGSAIGCPIADSQTFMLAAVSARMSPCFSVQQRNLDQLAPRPNNTTGMVFSRIFRSRLGDQLSMYSISSSIQRRKFN